MLFKTLLVIVLSMSGVLSQRGWGVTYTPERICALKGSSVDMSCTYSYPTPDTVQKTFWVIYDWNSEQEGEDLSQDPEYSDRVKYLGNKNNDCTFRINQLRESDSKTYRFRILTDLEGGNSTGEPGVTLEVADLQVMVNPDTVTEGQSVKLTCSTTCTLTRSPAFIWYRDGSPLSFTDQSHQFTASSEDAGRYSCAVKGYGLQSPAVALNVRYPPKSASVSVSPSGEIVEGSSVTLTCSSNANPPVHRYTWYRKGGSAVLWRGSEGSYTINKVNPWDAGEYYCEAENAIGTKRSPPKRLGVQYAPKNTSVSVSPSGDILEGSSVTLTCSSDANPPVQNYTWFKKNDTGVWQAGIGQSLNFPNFRSWNRGQYYCEAQNRLGAQNASALQVTVQGGQSLIAAAAVGVAAILALVFLGFVCVRKRKSTNETEGGRQGNKSPIYGNVSGMAVSHTGTQGTDRDNGEVPLYASVQPANTHNQERLLPPTDQKPLPQCEEGIQYASIQFPPSSAAPRSPAPSVKEDCVLYSTLRKLDM